MQKKSTNQPYLIDKKFPTWRTLAKNGQIFTKVTLLLLLATACNSEEKTSDLLAFNTSHLPQFFDEDELDEYYPSPIPNMIEIPTQGVVTKIKEVNPYEFAVIEEDVIGVPEESTVEVIYMNGTVKTYTLEQAKELVKDSIKTIEYVIKPYYNPIDTNDIMIRFPETYNTSKHSLTYVILGSAFAYQLGKPLYIAQNPNVYEKPHIHTSTSGVYPRLADNKRILYTLRGTMNVVPIPEKDQTGKSFYSRLMEDNNAKETIASNQDTIFYYYENSNSTLYLSSSYYNPYYRHYVITDFYNTGSKKSYISNTQRGNNNNFTRSAIASSRPIITKPTFDRSYDGGINTYHNTSSTTSNYNDNNRNYYSSSSGYNSSRSNYSNKSSSNYSNNSSYYSSSSNTSSSRTNYSSVSGGSSGHFGGKSGGYSS